MKATKPVLIALLFIWNTFQLHAAEPVYVNADHEAAPVQFAVKEVNSALAEKGYTSVDQSIFTVKKLTKRGFNIIFLNLGEEESISLSLPDLQGKTDELRSEGFLIHRSGKGKKSIWILGQDNAGLMYGGLELAEIIKTRGMDAVQDDLQNPYMKVRGTKFNIPLDVRTPTYTEPCDAAQKNMEEMWSFEFWKDYIDHLARYRYNTISLWSMHPFPSMVKVPEYPDIALEDVRRSTVDWEENYELNGWGFDAPEIVNNYEVIKKMSIDDKIDFWRKVMAYGKQRNVQFFVLTWNIFVYGTEGKYGITDKLENPVTTDYFRKSIKQMILTYPDLAGIGLTTGENMYDYTTQQKEEWAFATYGQGVLDALKEQPDRKINLIHRQHQTQAKEISKIFSQVRENRNINFIFSFKYAKAHVYSSVNQVYHQEFVEDIKSANFKTLWTLRNDDIFQFRWGAPDFVRDFIRNIPYDVSEGYYYGSDQYVWGREFIGRYSSEPREIDIAKHWYQWMCWGRLGYNPDVSNQRFTDIIQARFPAIDAGEMFDAWQRASMIYPWVTGFHWGQLDFQWYIESGQSRDFFARTPSGYHDVNRFITLLPHKGTGYMSIPEYTRAYLSKAEMKGETPMEVAEKIMKNANKALAWADSQSAGMNKTLRITIDDIKTISLLGNYYAHKIRAATYLSLFRETYEKEWHDKTIAALNVSAGYWRQFAACALANYTNPLWTNRVGYVDWKENFAWACYDISANGGEIDLPSMDPSPGGTILGAEIAQTGRLLEKDIPGFTGDGYLATPSRHAVPPVSWTYEADTQGTYILEFRYTLERHTHFASPLIVNGTNVAELEFWNTGNTGAWFLERVIVDLDKGSNRIVIAPEGFVLLDHLNIIKQ